MMHRSFVKTVVFCSGLLSKFLLADPDSRITIAEIKADRWFTQGERRLLSNRSCFAFKCCYTHTCVCSNLQVQSERSLSPETSFLSQARHQYPGPGQGLSFVFAFFVLWKTKRFTGPAVFMPSSVPCSDDGMKFSTSQPDLAAGGSEAVSQLTCCKEQVSFSQPIKPEHMLLTTQLLCTPGASQVKTTATAVCFLVKSQRKIDAALVNAENL